MPFLSIKRRAALDTRRRTQRFSVSTQKRRYCRFGRNRRLVLLLAWETLFPTIGPLPVTSQTRAISTPILLKRWSLTAGRCCPTSLSPHLARRVAVTRDDRETAKPAIIAHPQSGCAASPSRGATSGPTE